MSVTYCSEKNDKRVNTIIEIRKEILEALRKKSDNIDRLIFTREQQKVARQEIREIAEMVSEKDALMEKLKQLCKVSKKRHNQTFCLIYEVRREVADVLHKIKANIVAEQYDKEELEIVLKELKEFELILDEKDRLVGGQARGIILKDATSDELKEINPHLSKYFCMDGKSSR